jgi:membrane fusion protein (multidrug efflux system)
MRETWTRLVGQANDLLRNKFENELPLILSRLPHSSARRVGDSPPCLRSLAHLRANQAGAAAGLVEFVAKDGRAARKPHPASDSGALAAPEGRRVGLGCRVLPMKFFLRLFGVILVAGGMAAVWLGLEARLKSRGAAAGGPGAAAAGPARVVVFAVKEVEFADDLEALGTVAAAESAEISAKVTETVEELLFEDGQAVEEGDVLARLSAQEVLAGLEGARASLAEHERELGRLRGLVKDGAAPAARLDERETLAEVARRRIQEGEARMEDRVIRAPFSGRVGLRRISPGALVAPGTVLVTLDKLDTVRLDFQVPEVFLPGVTPGMTVEARSPAWPGRVFEGAVSQLDSRVDPVSRAVTVRAELKNEDLALRPGMLMTVRARQAPRQALIAPERALTGLGRRQFVYVVRAEKDGAGASVEQVEVTLGSRRPGFVEITAGVAAGDLLVTDGAMGLRSGDAVVVTGEFEAPAAPFNPKGAVGAR